MAWSRVDLEPDENSALKFEWGSDDAQALRDFKLGVRLMRERSYARALFCFRRAAEAEPNNPYFLSYFGLALALSERKLDDAIQRCELAVRQKRSVSQLYLNLAEVYLRAGRKSDAIETLEVCNDLAGRDARVKRMLQFLGRRRSAVLPFLNRKHVLNRGLGRLRHNVLRLLRTP